MTLKSAQKMRDYIVVENRGSGVDAIKLLAPPYEGVIFSYGCVEIVPDEEAHSLTIKFDYEVHQGLDTATDPAAFQQYIGDLLQDMIREGIASNTLTYTGGIEHADGDTDFIESDK